MATALLDLSVLTTHARTRGIGRYVADLGRSLGRAARTTTDVRVLGLESLSWLGTANVTEDLAGAVLRLTDAGQPIRPHASWAYRLRLSLAPAARALSPDLVHTGHPNATPLGSLGCPRITTCHDLIPLRYPEHFPSWRDGYRRGRERLDTRRFRTADHVIAVSETTANDLVTLLGVPAGKVTVVYNGVDLERWSSEPSERDAAIRQRFGLEDANYVLCVGAAGWRKNHDRMLDALALVRRRLPDADVILIWAARLTVAERRELRSAARHRGVSPAVRLVGYVADDELAALYRGAVAELFASRAEGFGYPLLEAMACGCPVVTSDRSSLAEVAGDAAIQVDPESAEAIAEGITALTTSSQERRRLSARGTARAREFSLEQMAAGTLDVYRQVLRRGRC